MRDHRDSADCLLIRNDDGDLYRNRRNAWKSVDARGDEAGYGQHSFVLVIVTETRNVGIDRSRCGCTVTREMRMHLPRVVMGCLVVVEMDVRHRSGNGAH
ncbi:MAG TPA: hypothetical protein VMS40_02215, partial [Vicinamibacterales bacterium]|nr:hypothetical protein [Vicinamibacterales bacterium]